MTSRLLMAALAAAAFTASAPLVAQVPGTADTQGIKAGAYQVDGAHTQALAKVMHLGFNPYFLLFGDATGTLQLDPAKLAASKVSVTLPLSGLRTNSDELTKHLLTPDFFDAAKFPAITFTSTTVKPTGATTADITGNLTIKGVTRPVTLKAKFIGQGIGPMNKAATVGFTGETEIKRKDFGVSYGVPFVSDEVDLKITAAFELK